MPDFESYTNKNLADKTLDALEGTIRGCQPGRNGPGDHQGFHPDDVILMIKLWMKATEIRMGYTGGDWVYYQFKRKPPKLVGPKKRSDVLWDTIENFRNNPENQDYFRSARDAMLNFVWDYRWHLTDVNDTTDFVHKLNRTISGGLQGLANEALLPDEQNI
jgi:hypothetical protein